MINKDYDIIRVNNSYCSLFRLKRNEVIGKKCYDVWPGHLCDTPDCTLKQILEGKKNYEYKKN